MKKFLTITIVALAIAAVALAVTLTVTYLDINNQVTILNQVQTQAN